MKINLWAPFNVRILDPGESAHDGELVIAPSAVGLELDEMDLQINTAPIVNVMRAIGHGASVSAIAVEDMSAQTTSALAVAVGVSLPEAVCIAAVLYDSVGPDAVDPERRVLIDAYYGYRKDVCARESQRRKPSEDRILRRMLRYWRKIVHDPDRVHSFASVGRMYDFEVRLGVVDARIDRSNKFCVVESTGWAFPVGFSKKDTVVLVQEDDWGCRRIAIGSLAKDLDFMRLICRKLSEVERATRVRLGVSARRCRWKISRHGDYITPPRKTRGTALPLERIAEIVRSSMG